jgi:hypothetical protein
LQIEHGIDERDVLRLGIAARDTPRAALAVVLPAKMPPVDPVACVALPRLQHRDAKSRMVTRALEWRAANAMTYWSRQSRRHT